MFHPKHPTPAPNSWTHLTCHDRNNSFSQSRSGADFFFSVFLNYGTKPGHSAERLLCCGPYTTTPTIKLPIEAYRRLIGVTKRARGTQNTDKQFKFRDNGDYRNRSKQACNEKEAKKTRVEEMWAGVMLEANQGGKTFPDFESDGVGGEPKKHFK